MTRDQIERAERTAELLAEARRWKKPDSLREHTAGEKMVDALDDASRWKRPRSLNGSKQYSLAARQQEYTFTDEQFRIALASLERNA